MPITSKANSGLKNILNSSLVDSLSSRSEELREQHKAEQHRKDLTSINALYQDLENEDIVLNELANQNTASMQKYNAEEAEKARNWQTQMSNTSHQREVADLRAAGLNPVLSANSGAASYTTSSASSTIDSAISAVANKEISRLTTAATVNAAEISAEMVGRAAEISANASRYASDMAYKSTKYSANKGLAGMQASASATRAAAAAQAAAAQYAANQNYAAYKYTADHQKYGYGTKILTDSGFTDKATKGLKKVVDYFSNHVRR